MLQRVTNWVLSHAPSPEKQAEHVLSELYMELYQAGQRVMDVQIHTGYYYAHLIFLEGVVKRGIGCMSGRRRGKQESAHALHAGLKFTAGLRCESQSCNSHMFQHCTTMSFIDPHSARVDDPYAPEIHHFSKIPVGSWFDDNVSALPSKYAVAEKVQCVS